VKLEGSPVIRTEVLRILTEGDCTPNEIALELGCNAQRMCNICWFLELQRKIQIVGRIREKERGPAARLYRITDHGRTCL
jgi:hypothetical protein